MLMLNNLRKRMPDAEEAGAAAIDRVVKAANNAAQSAKVATEQLGEWTKDGLESVRTRPLMWSAASLGFGALVGGLYALWCQAKPNSQAARRTMPVRSRAKQSLRAATESPAVLKNRGKKTPRARSVAKL